MKQDAHARKGGDNPRLTRTRPRKIDVAESTIRASVRATPAAPLLCLNRASPSRVPFSELGFFSHNVKGGRLPYPIRSECIPAALEARFTIAGRAGSP
eukprot:3021289-Prymnesium_polylepis.2